MSWPEGGTYRTGQTLPQSAVDTLVADLASKQSAFTKGSATLSGGTATVSTAAVTANSLIFLTAQSGTLNLGFLYITTRTAGVSFVVNSSNVLDARTFAWFLVEP